MNTSLSLSLSLFHAHTPFLQNAIVNIRSQLRFDGQIPHIKRFEHIARSSVVTKQPFVQPLEFSRSLVIQRDELAAGDPSYIR